MIQKAIISGFIVDFSFKACGSMVITDRENIIFALSKLSCLNKK